MKTAYSQCCGHASDCRLPLTLRFHLSRGAVDTFQIAGITA